MDTSTRGPLGHRVHEVLSYPGACKPFVLTRGNFNICQDYIFRAGQSFAEIEAPRATAVRTGPFQQLTSTVGDRTRRRRIERRFSALGAVCAALRQSAGVRVPEDSGRAGRPVLVEGVSRCTMRRGCSRSSTSSPVPRCYTERSQRRG